jgi:hypothetical protein
MSPAEKAREFMMLEEASRAVWMALPPQERTRRRRLARRARLEAHARLLRRLAGASCAGAR